MLDVSVVIPTFNRAPTLPASVASVLAQEGVDFEVVVVDDGSTDSTSAVLAGMADPRLRVIRAPHEGIAVARNRGVAAARAPVVAFHDSDDLALPGRLAVPVAYLREHPDVDVVIQNGRVLPPAGEGEEKPWIRPEVARTLVDRPLGVTEVFRWNLGQLQGICFTRRALEATGGFDPDFEVLEDLDLVLRVTIRFRAAFVDMPAFAYRRHAEGASADRTRLREASIRLADKLVREHPEVLEQLGPEAFRHRQARRYARLAEMRARAGDVGGARAALERARALHPTHVGYRLRAFLLALRAR
jgi:glycosyltransferase involved in cell wall biosynthesis